MSYGVIEYNEDGQPMCEICGNHFERVIAHARQKHHISEREYKLQFGLNLKKGICSKQSAEKSRERVFENYEKCIGKNLELLGEKTRFKVGSEGRTQDKVSEQTRLMLVDRAKNNMSQSKRKELGKALGLSGLGNKKRWNNK
jgi:hypothetical protein